MMEQQEQEQDEQAVGGEGPAEVRCALRLCVGGIFLGGVGVYICMYIYLYIYMVVCRTVARRRALVDRP